MTEKDEQLIRQAEKLSCTRWYEVQDLIARADTEEAREHLRAIESLLYHREEYDAGLL